MTNQLRASLVVAVGILFCMFIVYAGPAAATGIDADNMCDPVYVQCKCGEDPDPMTGVCAPGGKNKYMCPPGPQVCYDNTNNHMTTGTCDRPKHCKTDTCGGTECKQPKPGEQSGEPKGGEPKGGEEKGQGQAGGQGQEKGQGDGKGGQMPEMPKGGGGGGGQPQQPQQQGKENCVFSAAYDIPCKDNVSALLGNESAVRDDAVGQLESMSDAGENKAAVDGEKPKSAPQAISDGLARFWRGLTGMSDTTQEEKDNIISTDTGTIAANSTFAPPPLPDGYTSEQESSWFKSVTGWFSGFFK